MKYSTLILENNLRLIICTRMTVGTNNSYYIIICLSLICPIKQLFVFVRACTLVCKLFDKLATDYNKLFENI